jgi:hypothetical protein
MSSLPRLWDAPGGLMEDLAVVQGGQDLGHDRILQLAGGQPHPLLARLTQPEDPRPTSTTERPGNHPGQEDVREQQHRPLLGMRRIPGASAGRAAASLLFGLGRWARASS